MITIIAITLVLVGASLIFRNFMPDKQERFYPTGWNLCQWRPRAA
jgi:hypothetical protein